MDVLSEYLDWLEHQRRVAATSLRMYENVLGHFWADVVGPRDPSDVGIEELETWVQRPRTGGRAGKVARLPAAATVSRDVNILRSFYKWAHARSYVDRDAAHLLVAPEIANEMPNPLSDDDWVAWWSAPLDADTRAILALGFVGGLRRAEIASLRAGHLDVANRTLVNVRRKGHSSDTVPFGLALDILGKRLPQLLILSSSVVEELTRLRGEADDLLLSFLDGVDEKWRPDQLNRIITRTARRQGLPPFTPHQLRHSCATNLLRAGVPLALVSRYLNHRSISTTMRYARAAQDELHEWARDL